MFLLRLLNHSGSTLKSCWLQLLQDSAGGSGSVLLLSQLKEKTGNICSFFFFFADVIKYGDILEIALKLQQFFPFFPFL